MLPHVMDLRHMLTFGKKYRCQILFRQNTLSLLLNFVSGKIRSAISHTKLIPAALAAFYLCHLSDVDQSDPIIQDQMEQYVKELVDYGRVEQPVYFWLQDFRQFVRDEWNSKFDNISNQTLGEMTFDEQINAFLSVPIWYEVYSEQIALSDGKFRHSRCVIHIDVDLTDAKDCIDTLNDMRAVSSVQPINSGKSEWPFFTYAADYHLWEFFNEVVNELTMTTIVGIITISCVTMIFIPHWTGVLFVFPFITFLYLDMLGKFRVWFFACFNFAFQSNMYKRCLTLQKWIISFRSGFLHFAGVEVNAISYIVLVLSIGLMVDFIVHILLRYYESSGSREDRVKETLETIGSSILLGAFSTFLGVLLLVFSTSVIIQNIFVSFIGLVTFGILHGLLFLPVVLAMIGPEQKECQMFNANNHLCSAEITENWLKTY